MGKYGYVNIAGLWYVIERVEYTDKWVQYATTENEDIAKALIYGLEALEARG